MLGYIKHAVAPAVFVVACAVAIAAMLDRVFPFDEAPRETRILSFPVASPGPIEVELQHTNGKFTFRLGGAGYPVVIDPSSGKRWILLPVKGD
jgi:hypothetical protein